VRAVGPWVAGWFALLAGLAALGTALGLRPEPGAQSSLEHAIPAPSSGRGLHGGYSRFTAEELNRVRQGRELRRINYVGRDVPSEGPDTVSVNVIDDFTWGAAAFSTQTDRCYVVVAVSDRANPRYGSTRYGWLPEGERCVGRSATLAAATGDTWPQPSGSTTWTAVDILLAGAVLLPPLGVLLMLWRHARIGRRPIAALITVLPLTVLATVAWWFLLSATVGALEEAWAEFGRWEYGAAVIWAVIGSIPPWATAIAFVASNESQAALDRRVGLAAIAALLASVPITLIVVATSII
jgi:hypothetical protein